MENVANLNVSKAQQTTHPFAAGELVLDSIPSDERLWVPMVDGVWLDHLCLTWFKVVGVT